MCFINPIYFPLNYQMCLLKPTIGKDIVNELKQQILLQLTHSRNTVNVGQVNELKAYGYDPFLLAGEKYAPPHTKIIKEFYKLS